MLRYLQERAHREYLHVLVPILASAEAPNLPEPADVVLVVDTYRGCGEETQSEPSLRGTLERLC
jgi:hypothetical protein